MHMPTETRPIYSPNSLDHVVKQLPKTFTSRERAAAARAISHIGIHMQQSDEQLSTQRPGGLHPSYFPAHAKGTGSMEDAFQVHTLLDESVGDIFDAVSSSTAGTCCELMLSCSILRLHPRIVLMVGSPCL